VGTFTRRLAASPSLRRLLSIDISADAVEHCRVTIAHPSVEFRTADVVTVDGAFDLIVCMNVLEHIEDDYRALRHMLSLLRPGGTLFLLVPSHDLLYSDFDRASGHYRRYSKARMAALFARAAEGRDASLQRQCY